MADTERQTRRRLPVNLACMKINERTALMTGAGMHVCCTVAERSPLTAPLRSAGHTHAAETLLARLSLAHGRLAARHYGSTIRSTRPRQAAPLAAATRTTGGAVRYVHRGAAQGTTGAAHPKPNQTRGCDHLSYNKHVANGTTHNILAE